MKIERRGGVKRRSVSTGGDRYGAAAMKLHRGRVDDIPLIYVKPAVVSRHRLVIFLHGFGGTKESILSRLEELAGLGFTALGFDAWQHGERMVADARELRERVLGNIRPSQKGLENARRIWNEMGYEGK